MLSINKFEEMIKDLDETLIIKQKTEEEGKEWENKIWDRKLNTTMSSNKCSVAQYIKYLEEAKEKMDNLKLGEFKSLPKEKQDEYDKIKEAIEAYY